ncbi:MAG: hypothetical protein IPH32_13395 [Bacteroidetes bacterium]|nr:hypothetical protein [Bacteroidota bacterium]
MQDYTQTPKSMSLSSYKIAITFLLSPFSFFAQTNTALPSKETKEKNYKSSIMLKGHYASNTKAVGLKYTGVVVLKNHQKCAIGFNLASEKIWPTDNLVVPTNFQSNVLFGIVGLDFQFKLNDQLFFQPEFSILIGQEQITQLISTPASYNQYGIATSYNYSERNTDQIISGGHLEQHLFYYPKKAKNLVLGVSIFERFLNAKYYEEDLGVCGYLGINF